MSNICQYLIFYKYELAMLEPPKKLCANGTAGVVLFFVEGTIVFLLVGVGIFFNKMSSFKSPPKHLIKKNYQLNS